MKPDRPSSTAFRVAMRRAAHQILDRPLVLEDPIALRIVGSRRADEIRANPKRYDSSFGRALRLFLVARSRCAEDALASAVARGVRQYVILGAGLDTFAYRSPFGPNQLRVFVRLREPPRPHACTELRLAGVRDRSDLDVADRLVLDVRVRAAVGEQPEEVRLPGAVGSEDGDA